MDSYHSKKVGDVLKELKTSLNGLSQDESSKRLSSYGYNELKEVKKKLKFQLFIEQFKNFLVLILVFAAIISFFIKEVTDAVLIFLIVIFNAYFGFIQEYKAEKAIEALKKLTSLNATVIRDGKQIQILTKELVPGDIILLDTGSKVPADSRLIEISSLETQEASLTGESTPVIKTLSVIKEDAVIADQKNMVFSSTIVTKGHGKAVVVRTGMNTEIGKIATLIQKQEDELTPLQEKLDRLGKKLGMGALGICAVILILLLLKEGPILGSLLIAVSLAVAAIPEGLPAIVTISLSIGVKRMIKKNVLIRKLPAVETLGSTNVIISDKTGTLTKNEMTVKKIYVDNSIIEVTGSGYENKGDFFLNGKKYSSKELELLLKIGLLCNNSSLNFDKNELIGDPTEVSLIVSASKLGLKKADVESENKRIGEIPFEAEKKYMATLNQDSDKEFLYVKGAPDVILHLCSHILIKNKKIKLDSKKKNEILDVNDKFSKEALRVLGFAYKETNEKNPENLVFIGLQAMIDPPRENIKDDIEKCYAAGIKVKIVTGDYIGTAVAIGREIGITGKSISGQELDKIDDNELKKLVENYDIYARVTPEHKLRIVTALKELGYIVAVTGDGVNDAPALKKADIGIAMGITGTDVSKEASDMILTDDNFNSIVNAVEEGRIVYANIQKFVSYLLSVNIAEILIILIPILSGLPLPLIAIQILWMNLVTDGLPALALSVDPPEKNIMKKKPRKPTDSLITKELFTLIIISNIVVTAGVLLLYYYYIGLGSIIKAQTVAFTTIVLVELIRVYLIRKYFDIPLFKSNKYLFMAVFSSLVLQLIVIYTPLNKFFKVVSLSITDLLWILVALIGMSIAFIISEIVIKAYEKQHGGIRENLLKFQVPQNKI